MKKPRWVFLLAMTILTLGLSACAEKSRKVAQDTEDTTPVPRVLNRPLRR